jgi:hypothetical protein
MIYPNDSPDFWCLEWMISSISSPKIFFGDDLFGVWRCWSSVGETNSAQHIQHIHILLQNYVFWNVKQNYIWFKYDLYIFSFLSPNSSITVLFAVLKVTKVHQFPSQDLWSISTFLAYHIVPTLSWQKTTYIYTVSEWWFQTCFSFSIQLGMSSSQLTLTPWCFRGVGSNHQPVTANLMGRFNHYKWWFKVYHQPVYPYAPWCWNIYQHLSHKSPKCRHIFHTWSIWVWQWLIMVNCDEWWLMVFTLWI